MSASDLEGKTAIVTGANRGIGKETAVGLAAMGATVVMTARNQDLGRQAVGDVAARSGNSRVELVHLDLASLDSVHQAARQVLDRHEHIHILVNNAGATIGHRQETRDGFELTFGANHLGPFLFTNLLLERIKASAPARIVNVASGAHRSARKGINFDDLQATQGYRGFRAYGQSKLANILFTLELAQRLEGTGVTVNAVHPGLVATNFAGQEEATGLRGLLGRALRPLIRTPAEGADTSIYLATSSDLDGMSGEYYTARKIARRSRAAGDRDAARRLWDVSERLVAPGTP